MLCDVFLVDHSLLSQVEFFVAELASRSNLDSSKEELEGSPSFDKKEIMSKL